MSGKYRDGTSRTKVLNLYAGLGGNRKHWENVDVVAVEKNPKIARFYANEFPEDEVVVADAHTFLEQHLRDGWDFIWSSPPCQTHTRFNTVQWNSDSKRNRNREPRYPDMRLYQEIILLKHFAECDWVVENVTSYYDPLIEPQRVDRHYFWSNCHIPDFEGRSLQFKTNGEYELWADMYGFDVSDVDLGVRKDQALKNCVDPELGQHVFDAASKTEQQTLPVMTDGGRDQSSTGTQECWNCKEEQESVSLVSVDRPDGGLAPTRLCDTCKGIAGVPGYAGPEEADS